MSITHFAGFNPLAEQDEKWMIRGNGEEAPRRLKDYDGIVPLRFAGGINRELVLPTSTLEDKARGQKSDQNGVLMMAMMIVGLPTTKSLRIQSDEAVRNFIDKNRTQFFRVNITNDMDKICIF